MVVWQYTWPPGKWRMSSLAGQLFVQPNRMAPVIKRKETVGPGVGQHAWSASYWSLGLFRLVQSHTSNSAVITCLPSAVSPLYFSPSPAFSKPRCFLCFPSPMILAFLSGLPVLSPAHCSHPFLSRLLLRSKSEPVPLVL